MVNENWASREAGETTFDIPGGLSDFVDHPIKILAVGFKGSMGNLKRVFSNRKMLISALILGGVWLVLGLLKAFNIDHPILTWLSIGTFAYGGLSPNPVEIVGGLFGKMVYGTMALSLLNGGHRGILSGIGKLFSSFKRLSPRGFSWLLIGLGIAMVGYNFMAGTPSISDAAVAIASLLIALRALGSANGFLKRFVLSLTSSKSVKKRFENKPYANALLSGGAIGFALSIPVSMVPLYWSGYLIGGIAVIAGIALYISKPRAIASLFMATWLVTLGMLPAFAIDVKVDETEHLPYDQPNNYHYDYDDYASLNLAPYNLTDTSQSLDLQFIVQINDYEERQYKPLSYDQIEVTLNNFPKDLEYRFTEIFMSDEINYGKPFQELWTTPTAPPDVISSTDFRVRQGDVFSSKVVTYTKPDAIYNKAIPPRPLDMDLWTYFVSLFSTGEYASEIQTQYKLEDAVMENTTMFGYPALVFTTEDKRVNETAGINDNYYTYKKIVFIYVNNVVLPPNNDVSKDENNKTTAVYDRSIIIEINMETTLSVEYAYSDTVINTTGFEAVYASHQAKEQEILETYKDELDNYLESFDQLAIDVRHTVEVADKQAMIAVETDASETPGEAGEESVTVPEAIVIGALSVIAAISAAGGAAATGSAVASGAAAAAGTAAAAGKKAESLTKKSTYQMRIRKDFGHQIKIGALPVSVYARMVEITESGQVIERPDMTADISIRAGSSIMKVDDQRLVEQYMGALISAEKPKGAKDTEMDSSGLIVFAYTGEGGVFENHVRFQLTGEPYIFFENLPSYSGVMTCEMIRGDGLGYQIYFEVRDFLNPPEVSIENSHGEVVCTLEHLEEKRYMLRIGNQTSMAHKLDGEKLELTISIKAENEKEIAESELLLIAYPEGLSVEGPIEEGHLIVRSYLNEAAGDLDYKIKPTIFHLKLAVIETMEDDSPKALLVPMSQVSITFEAMRSEDSVVMTILEKYKYELMLEHAKSGMFTLAPESCLPELENPYYAVLPVTGTYKDQAYALELPIRLVGEKENPMKARDEEFKLLLLRVREYMPPDEWSDILGKIKEQQNALSVTEMRLMSKSIIRMAQKRWGRISEAERAWADQLDWIIYGLEWVKWFGDQAFAYIATVYTGPVGEALLSPAKEIFTNMIGEVGIQIVYGESFDFEKLQLMNNLSASLDNLVMSAADPATLNIRQLAAVLAGFTIFNTAKNYVLNVDKDGKRDFYKAITDAFSNLTSNAMKILASDLFGKAMRSPQARNAMNTTCGKWVRENLQKYMPNMEMHFDNAFANGIVSVEKLAIVEKYITEFVGMGASTVYTKLNEHKLTTSPDDVIFTVSIWKDVHGNDVLVDISLKAVGEKLYDFVFDSLFAIFPFSTGAVTFDEDPPFIDEA